MRKEYFIYRMCWCDEVGLLTLPNSKLCSNEEETLNTKVYHIIVSNNGINASYNNKAQAILAIATNLIQTISTKDLTISQLKGIKDDLKTLNDLQVGAAISSEFIEYTATAKTAEVENNTFKQTTGYVFSTDLPKTFHTDLNSAKVELLFEILDTYISMNKITKTIQLELVEDLKGLLNETEPYIAGCGQITKVIYK